MRRAGRHHGRGTRRDAVVALKHRVRLTRKGDRAQGQTRPKAALASLGRVIEAGASRPGNRLHAVSRTVRLVLEREV